MATVSTAITEAVKDVKGALSLADGTQYVLQYQGGGELRLQSAASAPQMDSAVFFRLYDGDTATVRVVAGENIYGWSANGSGVAILDSVS